MKKKQTYLAVFKDANGNVVTFERFSYKRLNSVCKALDKLLNNALYRACVKDTESIDIYETEDTAKGEPIVQLSVR